MSRFIVLLILFSSFAGSEVIGQRVFDVDLSGKIVSVNREKEVGDSPFARCFLPDSSKATGRAIVALPGGGYGGLVFKEGGYDWAPFFNEQGIAFIVLHYRLPGGNLNLPITDVKKAFNLICKYASEWNIRTDDIGIMGFSAGGHLAATIATHPELGVCPKFQILFYPIITMDKTYTDIGSCKRFLGENPSEELIALYSCEKQVTKKTPPAIIFLSSEDNVVSSLNSVNYYLALLKKRVSASIHAYPSTWHGWGIKSGFPYIKDVCVSLSHWLQNVDLSKYENE